MNSLNDPRGVPPRSRFKKLPPRYNGIVTPLVLSMLMCCIVSGISTLKGVGPTPGAFRIWISAWALSWLVAFPTLLFVLPLVRRIVGVLVEPATR
jgi:hypothetical protein